MCVYYTHICICMYIHVYKNNSQEGGSNPRVYPVNTAFVSFSPVFSSPSFMKNS